MQSIANSLPVWAQLLLAFVPAISTIFAAVGLGLNFVQARRNNAQARATIVAKCIERFTDDEDMQAIFYSIEYSKFEYRKSSFHGSIEEKQLDKLLMHFSAAALSWRAGLLENDDIQPLQYLVRRILRDQGVIDYLEFVSQWSSQAGLGEHPYRALSEMGEVLEES